MVAQQAALFSEIYRNTHRIFIFKEVHENGDVGDPVLIYLASKMNISDIIANKKVAIRFTGYTALTAVLTFRDELEASNFCNVVRPHTNPLIAVPVPSEL